MYRSLQELKSPVVIILISAFVGRKWDVDVGCVLLLLSAEGTEQAHPSLYVGSYCAVSQIPRFVPIIIIIIIIIIICQQFDETIDYIIPACPMMAKEQYIKDMIECVHNYTSTYARKQGHNWTKKHWYEHVPKSVETSQGGKVTI